MKIMRFKTGRPDSVIPILWGRLRGKKWIVASSNNGWWFWLGLYEYEKQVLFAKTITKGAVVYDIGGHVGFYTLLASEIVGQCGKVITFEPLPRNLRYLYNHLSLNRCNNVKVIEAATAEESGTTLLAEGRDSFTGYLSPTGNVKIKKVALDDLVLNGEIPPPDYIKIDVEGAELAVFAGARRILQNFAPVIFLATHGADMHRHCCDLLTSFGYRLQSVKYWQKNITATNEILAVKDSLLT